MAWPNIPVRRTIVGCRTRTSQPLGQLQRMQVGHQIVNLLWRKFLLVSRHLVSAEEDEVAGALVVGGHSAYRKVLFAKYSLQSGALALAGGVWFVATVTILIVKVP